MTNYDIRRLEPALYFVATPIGNARDITLRALDTLASADVIAAEDTRTARKLMDIHGVPVKDRRFIAYHDHSGPNVLKQILDAVRSGQSVAYVSEAGSPLISDPGFELGREAAQAGVPVTVVPGPTAAVAALSVSGLATDAFAFLGFLPNAKSQRRTAIADAKALPMTLMFYESPKRVAEMLRDLSEILGPTRQAAVCRELTKRFETVERGTLDQLADVFSEGTVKGEIVVLVERPGKVEISQDDIDEALLTAMKSMRVKDAATTVAGAMGLPRRDVYQRALALGKNE